MTRLRRVLGPLAAIWLCCHVGLGVCTAAALTIGAAEEMLDCDCVHGDNVMCPMHHKSAAGTRICLIGSADDGGAAVISSMFALVGVLAASTPSIGAPSALPVLQFDVTTTSRRPVPPDPPPPRA